MRAQHSIEQRRRERLAVDVASRIGALFEGCPGLVGFHLEYHESLAAGAEAPVEGGLLVGEVTVASMERPALRAARDEIAVALVELLDEYPEAHELLRDRTFARSVH